jgi:hypothetical protein
LVVAALADEADGRARRLFDLCLILEAGEEIEGVEWGGAGEVDGEEGGPHPRPLSRVREKGA